MIDTSKIVHAPVGGGRYTVTSPIVKEDYGLYLKIEGLELPSTYEVDFSNSENSGTSVTMIGNADGVLIPHQFIDTGKDVFAFLYHVGEDYGRTIFKFRIPNKVRPDRTDDVPTPEEQSTIDQAISALNSAVAQAAQDVETTAHYEETTGINADLAERSAENAQTYASQAEQSATDAHESASQASASATASAQSAQSASQSAQTASEKADSITGLTATAQTLPSGSSATASYSDGVLTLGIPRGADGTDGTDGVDGQDGVSPTVTITPIAGGHRITITDADGSHSADVMDGHNGMVTEYVTGTTPTITAQADTRYVCGEVATLDFTPPASGICDVVFTSGSTPTVVTLPSTVKFPDGAFTAEADTTYEINILDGIYGAVMAWT